MTSTTTTRTRSVAAFLGDSFTSGFNGSGFGSAGWPASISASLHLRLVNLAVPGTGFVNPGWTGQPIRTRVAAVIRTNPRIVFVAGGHNDRRFGATRTGVAAGSVLEDLRRALPHATLVVLGPIWSSGNPPASVRRIRDELGRDAERVDALFIDPLAGGWFSGSARRLIGPDGLHPTNAGHRHIASLVLRALEHDKRTAALLGPTSSRATKPDAIARAAGLPDGGTFQPAGCPS